MAPEINEVVKKVRLRLKWSVVLREMFRYATVFSLAAFVVAALSKFIHPLNHWPIYSGIICLGIFAGFFAGLRVKVRQIDAAMVADLRGNTGEKLTAYLESAERPSGFNELIESEALASLSGLDARRLTPWRLPRTARLLFPLIVLVTAMAFVPEFRCSSKAGEERLELELEETAKNIEKAATLLEKTENPDQQIEELRNKIEDLGRKLKRGEIDRKNAIAEIAKLSEELEKRLRSIHTKKARARKAADELNKSEETRDLANAMKSGDREKLGQAVAKLRGGIEKLDADMRSGDAEARRLAGKGLADMKKALENALEQAGSERGAKMSEELEKALAALDKIDLSKLGEKLPEGLLEELEKRLGEGLSEMLEGMEFSAEDLEKMMQALEEMVVAKEEALCSMAGKG